MLPTMGGGYSEPWVSYTEENEEVKYNKSEEEKNRTSYFTIEALESGTLSWNLYELNPIQYSKNGGEWAEMNSATSISIISGDTVAFKGTNQRYSTWYAGDDGDGCSPSTTFDYNVKGNIMSLINGDDFLSASGIPYSADHYLGAFHFFFAWDTHLINARNLVLPVETLSKNCYNWMFAGCTNLTSAPVLPATTLADNCYGGMFYGCTSLTTAPALPATTLADGCYDSMFKGCISLTVAPELPATTLAEGCYPNMFEGCTSLTTAPILPAATLTAACYTGMFSGCTSLTGITCLATNISASICTNFWVDGVASSGTFTKAASMSSWTSGVHGIPSNWTVQDAS